MANDTEAGYWNRGMEGTGRGVEYRAVSSRTFDISGGDNCSFPSPRKAMAWRRRNIAASARSSWVGTYWRKEECKTYIGPCKNLMSGLCLYKFTMISKDGRICLWSKLRLLQHRLSYNSPHLNKITRRACKYKWVIIFQVALHAGLNAALNLTIVLWLAPGMATVISLGRPIFAESRLTIWIKSWVLNSRKSLRNCSIYIWIQKTIVPIINNILNY